MKLAFLILTIATVFRGSHGFSGDFPPCEVCGCSFCAASEFPLGNPGGMVDLNVLNDEIGDVWLDRYGQTIGDIFLSFGLESVPCSLIDVAALGGAFPPEVCVDLLRLNPTFRNSCGCPDLPPSPPIALDSLTLPPAATLPPAVPTPTSPLLPPTRATLNPIFAPTPARAPTAKGVDESSSWIRIVIRWLGTFLVLLVLSSLVVGCCVLPAKKRRNNTASNTSSTQAPLEFDQQTIETQRTYLAAIEHSNIEKAIENSKRDADPYVNEG